MPIDHNEAPEGYKAVPHTSCAECVFCEKSAGFCMALPLSCIDDEREDKTLAMFEKKEDQP